MNQRLEQLSEAMNTYGPALALLLSHGYSLTAASDHEDALTTWTAESAQVRLSATDPLVLLGLAALWGEYGDQWQATGGSALYDRALDGETLRPDDARAD